MLAHPTHAIERVHGVQPAVPIPIRRAGGMAGWGSLMNLRQGSHHSRCGSNASMIFDLEMEDGEEAEAPRPHQSRRGLPELLGLAVRTEERTLWSHALQARDAALPPGSTGDIHIDVESFTKHLADSFAGKGLVWLRRGLAAMPSSDPTHATIKHSFAVASVPGLGFYIVDPNYKEQLAMSGGNDEYGDFLASLPPVLVANAEQLADWVRVACGEMHKVFAAKGLPTPPWREFNALIGRWLLAPGQAEDMQVDQLNGGAPSSLMLEGADSLDTSPPTVTMTVAAPAAAASAPVATTAARAMGMRVPLPTSRMAVSSMAWQYI